MAQILTVLGAGSWGTALALVLARNGFPVCLWARDPKHVHAMSTDRANTRYLPDITFPEHLSVSSDLAQVVSEASDIIVAVPSHAFAECIGAIQDYGYSEPGLVWATKGFDPQSGALLHDCLKKFYSDTYPVAVLSGPSFAGEVANELPTAVTMAGNDDIFLKRACHWFHCPLFRVYPSSDVIGVQLAGALKNVMAVAAGISDGLGYGVNTRSALITRGLAEMQRFIETFGGQAETLLSLAGVGDLMLTCSDDQSRNRRCGLLLGRGHTLDEVHTTIQQTIEGITTSQTIHQLAKRKQVEMPICEQVYQVLHQHRPVQEAVHALLKRA